MDYPIWEVAIGGGVLIGAVAIAHVIVAHFAIGGGLVIAASETYALRTGDEDMRDLAKRSSKLLILLSTVFGAISGVGIWVVAGLISPAAISALIRNYVWGWAIEWTFFVVEIVAALVYYATWDRVPRKVHVAIGWVYFVAAYLSLVVINGILTFMLTPGRWLETRAFWDGFFNPTYVPSLVLRTGIAVLLASAFLLFPAIRVGGEARARIARWLGWWLAGGAIVAYGGYRWWEARLPEDIRVLFSGDAPLLATLAGTRGVLLWSLALVLALGLLALVALPRPLARTLPAIVLLLGSFAFFGGYERLREGVRKPYLIHDVMFSNGVRVDEIGKLAEVGVLGRSGWAARGAADDSAETGRRVFGVQCASCHTIDGYQAIRPLLPDDPDMIVGVLYGMWAQGEAYADLAPGERVAKAELDYPFMPPLVGTEDEMEALAVYLATLVEPTPPRAALEVSR